MDLIKPITSFYNCDTSKNSIFELAKSCNNQGVVYCWLNQINNKSYVGSSVNLTVRLYKYYSFRHLESSRRPIEKSLLKYGYSNFSFHLLEYCKNVECIDREQ